MAAGEWLRRPSPEWAAAAVGTCVLALALSVQGTAGASVWRRRLLLVSLAALGGSLAIAERQLNRIEQHWTAEREARIVAASEGLGDDLHAAYQRAEGLAARAAEAAAAGDRTRAFSALGRLAAESGPEVGVAVLERTGTPWAWAGRHRLLPLAEGDSIASRSTPYYVTLEARRHSTSGRVAVATVLIWAHPAVPDREQSLAELFRRRTDVALRVFPPGTAVSSPDVFDYQEPTTAGKRLLFSVQPVPPEQGSAKELSLSRSRTVVAALLGLALLLAVSIADGPAARLVVLAVPLWVAARAPVGAALGVEALFSPATFFIDVGPLFSASAGALALGSALLSLAGIGLWRRRLPRRPAGVVTALLLLGGAPYALTALGGGITPPATGTGLGLWLTWQVALVLAVLAPIVLAAALLRGDGTDPRGWRVAAGIGIAVAAAIIGVAVWSPVSGWLQWYAFIWVPALILVTLPARRWAAVLGIAVVAGSLAEMVTWSAELSGRLEVAQRDVARLGSESDPLAVPPLERFGDEVGRAVVPASATELFALWHGSAPDRQRYPAHLALWSPDGQLAADLPLDSLDIPLATLAALARQLGPTESRRIVPLRGVPGMHYVLVTRVTSGSVLTAAIGPRSALVATARLGRLLDPAARRTLRYRLELAPAGNGGAAAVRPTAWRRDAWVLRSESVLALPGGDRTVHAVVDLRGPAPLLVRGALVILLDAVVLALLWLLGEIVAGARPGRPRWRSLARSFRIRLAVALFGFFIVPAVGFSAWSFARLADEARRGRDLLIAQTLRDAVVTAGGLLRAPDSMLSSGLERLSQRIDADLALYSGGALVASSAPILGDLGVLGAMMPPDAFQQVARGGELEVTRDGPVPSLAERIGYRVVEPGSLGGLGVLATPQLADDSNLGPRQLDLGLVLLLATLAGIGAALAGAQLAALALSRPVAELRRSAVALGQGRPMPPSRGQPPTEFAPVFGAFERMAADIRASQQALEESRARTATVLATVATGVVALDPAGRVLIANPRARQLLGAELAGGQRMLDELPGPWAPLRAPVERQLAAPAAATDLELTIGGRRLTVQLASLGPQLQGVVLALNDVTDVSRAERVLAWGEMARQVAHEIKNPLTPMRLGMQHLRRAYRDRRVDFGQTLEETAQRILDEIDRLDTIARAFSRFAAPVEEQPSVDRIDVAAVAGEVVRLYGLAEEGARVRLNGDEVVWAPARRDELKEVLVNLLENARTAAAAEIAVEVRPGVLMVRDDGSGIAPALLLRVFEPRFSTTTSGSGLGLPIVRRLVESWGGRVTVTSEVGKGTEVTIRFGERAIA